MRVNNYRRSVLFAILLSSMASTPSVQGPPGVEIVSLATEKCIDVAGNSGASGANVNQYACHGGPNQAWRLTPAVTPGFVSIQNQLSDKCLDVRVGGQDAGGLQQFDCHFRDNQLFRIERMTDAIGGFRIMPSVSLESQGGFDLHTNPRFPFLSSS